MRMLSKVGTMSLIQDKTLKSEEKEESVHFQVVVKKTQVIPIMWGIKKKEILFDERYSIIP